MEIFSNIHDTPASQKDVDNKALHAKMNTLIKEFKQFTVKANQASSPSANPFFSIGPDVENMSKLRVIVFFKANSLTLHPKSQQK